MTDIERLAKLDDVARKFILKLPPVAPIFFYSNARKLFLSMLSKDLDFPEQKVPASLNQKIWGIDFRSPIFNAAGMFKTGVGYEMSYRQGAGAFLAGTTTNLPRKGNNQGLIWHPFVAYHQSRSASNWMGLPNDGHAATAIKISNIEKKSGCPIGASIAADTGIDENESLKGVVEGCEIYNKAGADFLEINESCPNVVGHTASPSNFLDESLVSRLVYISEKFLKKRNRNLPVIVKLSNDTSENLIPALVDMLIELEYDGINFGNTSTNYSLHRNSIGKLDLQNFDYFTSTFGGGLSGAVLKQSSLNLATLTVEYIGKKNAHREFNVIRTGGISNCQDVIASKDRGIKLNQWFTGYFDAFAKFGHTLYSNMYQQL